MKLEDLIDVTLLWWPIALFGEETGVDEESRDSRLPELSGTE